MQEVITRLVDVPFARMFVLAGIVFLLVAVLGKVEGKIDPGNVGRLGSLVLGVVLMIVGIVMQYIEIREAALDRVAQQTRALSTASMAAPAAITAAKQSDTAAAATTGDKPTIKIVSGTYGRSCNAKPGNATAPLAKACDDHTACDFAADATVMEDLAPNCSKDFAAEWKCGSGSTVYSATLPATAGKNEKLHLACAE
jgi:hypothetical protein